MAKTDVKKRRKQPELVEGEEKESFLEHIADDVKHGAWSLLFFALTVFFTLSPFGKAGIAGNKMFGWLHSFLGIGYYLLPILCVMLGMSFLQSR
jgi:hypothetical protein